MSRGGLRTVLVEWNDACYRDSGTGVAQAKTAGFLLEDSEEQIVLGITMYENEEPYTLSIPQGWVRTVTYLDQTDTSYTRMVPYPSTRT